MAYWGNDYVTIKEMSFYKATIFFGQEGTHSCALYTEKNLCSRKLRRLTNMLSNAFSDCAGLQILSPGRPALILSWGCHVFSTRARGT